jgi:collagenase-like PrtC family protease
MTWVRPEDIKYYTGIGIHYFKLQGRQAVLKGDPVRAVESYFKESFDGDALELFDMFSPTSTFRVSISNKSLEGFIKPFLKQGENFCKRDCDHCKYCETFANEHLDRQKFEELKQMIHEFYDGYDQFKQLLDSITKEEVAAETNEPLEADVEDVDFDIE